MIQVEVVARISNQGILGKEHVLLTIEGESMEELETGLVTGLREMADNWYELTRPGVSDE